MNVIRPQKPLKECGDDAVPPRRSQQQTDLPNNNGLPATSKEVLGIHPTIMRERQ